MGVFRTRPKANSSTLGASTYRLTSPPVRDVNEKKKKKQTTLYIKKPQRGNVWARTGVTCFFDGNGIYFYYYYYYF